MAQKIEEADKEEARKVQRREEIQKPAIAAGVLSRINDRHVECTRMEAVAKDRRGESRFIDMLANDFTAMLKTLSKVQKILTRINQGETLLPQKVVEKLDLVDEADRIYNACCKWVSKLDISGGVTPAPPGPQANAAARKRNREP